MGTLIQRWKVSFSAYEQRLPLPKRTTHKPNNNKTILLSLLQNHPPLTQTPTKLIQTLSLTTHCTHPHSSSGNLVQYPLMIGPGSTNSRIHIYKFNNCGASPEYEYEVFKMTQPGLSSFAGNPEGAARSLDVLLDEALHVVPKVMHGCTLVAVKATAGLRLLPGSQSADILEGEYARLILFSYRKKMEW